MNEFFHGRVACKIFKASARHTGGRDLSNRPVMPAIDITTETQDMPVTVSARPQQNKIQFDFLERISGAHIRQRHRPNDSSTVAMQKRRRKLTIAGLSPVTRENARRKPLPPHSNEGHATVFSRRPSCQKDCPECSESPAKVRCIHNLATAHGHGE